MNLNEVDRMSLNEVIFADRRTRDLFIRVRNKIDSIGIEIDRVFILIFNFLIREASS